MMAPEVLSLRYGKLLMPQGQRSGLLGGLQLQDSLGLVFGIWLNLQSGLRRGFRFPVKKFAFHFPVQEEMHILRCEIRALQSLWSCKNFGDCF